ncbi:MULTISPECIES: hypothetical protein [Staphylococcus]|uniref:hypothetical protein n=1 Tax=Staphylococcus TaxID=1279 RepID=UPI0014435CCB|nr:hypothetical protein [Staphylococcus epidermidis]NKP41934.1 hypothetical protein [Staphylococcus aureus]MCG1567032.1 hypothetical protein [Staphylococcus epidermidis]NKP83770.1 hypothetical protein [Staphylococcus aureus]HCW0036256.1 hypothetical protein [Staphylococcus aureus]HCW0039037.1 hypothetical protein [Staphylococcus aureus]
MKLKNISDAFQDIHPIMNVLGSVWFVIPITLLCLLFAVIVIYTKLDSKYFNLITALSIICVVAEIVVGSSCIMKINYEPTYIYEGVAKVQNITPVDDNMKQKITLKNQDGSRILELPKTQIDGLRKNDEVKMKYHYQNNQNNYIYHLYSNGKFRNTKYTYIDKKTHKPKKYVNFEDMTDLERNIKLTKKQ